MPLRPMKSSMKTARLSMRRQTSWSSVRKAALKKAQVIGTAGAKLVAAPKRKPPASWKRDYPIILDLRKIKDSPVDSVGCERLADHRATKKTFEWQVLVSAMLSSQTKDQQNAEAMKNLHAHGNTIESIACISVAKLDRLIGMVGFHGVKAKNIKAAARICLAEHAGRIPTTLEGLLALPGVGPKMSHLVLHAAFDTQQGLCVDTHMHRIANQLGWMSTNTPEETRKTFESWLPKEHWPFLNITMVGFGQQQQQQSDLVIRRCLASSSPLNALRLVSKVGLTLRAGKVPELDEAAKKNVAIRRLLVH